MKGIYSSRGATFTGNARLKAMEMDFRISAWLLPPLLLFLFVCIYIMYPSYPLIYLGRQAFIFSSSILTMASINKDCFRGQSVAKHIMGYQVVSVKTGDVPPAVLLALRNVTVLIWPAEVLFTLVNSERRIGDILAGTRVMRVAPSDPEIFFQDLSDYEFQLSSLVALLVALLPSLLLLFAQEWYLRHFLS